MRLQLGSQTTGQPEDTRLLLYGGVLDLFNGTRWTPEVVRSLKHAALFYDHIIVEDGFFHCYGPLFDHFNALTKSGTYAVKNDELCQLIRAGIVVPVLRDHGESLWENLRKGARGIMPGKYLSLPLVPEVERSLGLVDQLIHGGADIIAWSPESLADPRRSGFNQRVIDCVCNPDCEWSLAKHLGHQDRSVVPIGELLACERYLDNLASLTYGAGFRRGEVETLTVEFLGLPSIHDVYETVYKRASRATPQSDLRALVGYLALCGVTTAYQVVHAQAYDCVKGLFFGHDDGIIEAGVFDALKGLQPLAPGLVTDPMPVSAGALAIDKLTISDIVRIRAEGPFGDWRKLLLKLRNGTDTNGAFLEECKAFIRDTYAPSVARFPSMAQIREQLAYTVLGVCTSFGTYQVLCWGFPVLTMVGLIGSSYFGMRAGQQIYERVRYMIARRGVEVQMNRYWPWRSNV